MDDYRDAERQRIKLLIERIERQAKHIHQLETALMKSERKERDTALELARLKGLRIKIV